MNDCVICQAIGSEKLMKLYEDNEVVVMLHPKPATLGHLIIVPREHYAIMETVPPNVLSKAAVISNRFSAFLFEALDAKGTNIIVANGIPAGQTFPHFTINVIPRAENDGLNFQWDAKQANEQELSDNQSSLSLETQKLIAESPKAHAEKPAHKEEKPVEREEKAEKIEKKEDKKTPDYIIKQLIRIP